MLSELIPPAVLQDLDSTTTLDDRLEVLPTSLALRALTLRAAMDRASGLRPRGGLDAPLVAQIEFTQRCNLSCDFCYNDSGPRNSDELEPSLLRRLVDELVGFDLTELIISGGEPLLRREQMQIILDAAVRSDTPVHLLTNGLLLDPETLAWLRDHGVVTVQVSLDGGNPSVHDRQRGRQGAWARSYEGLCRAHEAGFHTIISSTLTRENADSLPDLVQAAYLAGADVLNVGDLITWGRAETWMQEGACSHEQFDRAAETLLARKADVGRFVGLRLAVNMLFYICKLKIMGPESLLIRGNGNVLPHCTLSGLRMGNVREMPVEKIWRERCAALPDDPRLDWVLGQHEIVPTERLRQLRCFRARPRSQREAMVPA